MYRLTLPEPGSAGRRVVGLCCQTAHRASGPGGGNQLAYRLVRRLPDFEYVVIPRAPQVQSQVDGVVELSAG